MSGGQGPGRGATEGAGEGPVVRAAGGVVLRTSSTGALETLLVHRPAYDDWTVPKGKADGDEPDEACALREVEEETGLRCVLGRELAPAAYIDRHGRPKRVRYWTMVPRPGQEAAAFAPNDEIDELRWLPLAEAAGLVTYEHDRLLLREAAPRPLLLVRHAWAGDRDAWTGDDRLRPLDERGRRQAQALVALVQPFGPSHLLTSPYLRCVQTLEPLAAALGLPLEQREELAEGMGDAVLGLLPVLEPGTVLCTHGDLVELLAGAGQPKKKGSVWLLEREAGAAGGWAAARYLKPPA